MSVVTKEIMYLFKIPYRSAISTSSSRINIPKSKIITEIDVADQNNVNEFNVRTVSIKEEDLVATSDSVQEVTDKLSPLVYRQYIVERLEPFEEQPDYLDANYNYNYKTLYFTYDRKYDAYYTDFVYEWDDARYEFNKKTGPFFVLPESDITAYVNQPIEITESFRFHINPQNVVVSDTKISTKNLTSFGWSVQHWGNDMTSIDVKGQTRSMYPANTYDITTATPFQTHPMLETEAYKNLKTLRGWYREQNEWRNPVQPSYLIGFYYKNTVYIGYFENFSITDSADRPFVLEYSFRFLAFQEYGKDYDLMKQFNLKG